MSAHAPKDPAVRHRKQMTASPVRLLTTLIISASVLAACGGGGGASTPLPPSNTVWTPGVFSPASAFKDRCEVVRTGLDIENRPFPDRPGSALQERFWLRSWTHETYLWNTEVADQNPAGFTDRVRFFASQRTFATTPSGKEKDDFHFSEPTIESLARRNGTPSATYGISLALNTLTPPRDIRVRYTEPSSPASTIVGGQVNLVRGARILRVNGIDAVNANTADEVTRLNAALFPPTAGVAVTLEVQDPGGAPRVVSMTSVNLSPKAVNRSSVLQTPAGPVGYILFNTFSPFESEQEIHDAMVSMRSAGINDLVLDLRYNGGGLLAVASQLSYMVAGSSATQGRAFERLRFNAASGNRNPVTGQSNDPFPFFSTALGFAATLPVGTPLPTLNLPRVFVLSTGNTCSASEAVINGLRGIGIPVILIGDTTCGKPYGFYPQDNCGETYYTIQFQGTNELGFGDYADGFIPNNSPARFGVRLPGCQVADDLSRELGDPAEALLSTALNYRVTQACPSASGQMLQSRASPASSSGGIPLTGPVPSVFETNRDMTFARP